MFIGGKQSMLQCDRVAASVLLSLLTVAATASCGESRAAEGVCRAPSGQALTRAVAVPPIPLSMAEQASIGAIENEEGFLLCTGSLIADRWVLTASHCLTEVSDLPLFRTRLSSGEVRLPVVNVIPHPELDAALFEISTTSALADGDMVPLTVWYDPPVALGDQLMLCGYGDTENGSDGTLLFLQEAVVEVTDAVITVDGGTQHGACYGDSGGPLLAVTQTGAVGIVGILTGGNRECTGRDHFLRAGALGEWIEQTLEQHRDNPCGDLTWEGTCFSGRVQWCENNRIMADNCRGKDVCGWDVAAAGFRCVNDELDPCRGVGSLGICEGSKWVTCKRGTVAVTDCSACGKSCVWETEYVGCE